MTNVDQKLDATFVWDQAGHLTEAALHALADGELLVVEVLGPGTVGRSGPEARWYHLGCAIARHGAIMERSIH